MEAEALDDDGMPIAVLLHVIDGRLDELEVYWADSKLLLSRITAASLNVVPPQV